MSFHCVLSDDPFKDDPFGKADVAGVFATVKLLFWKEITLFRMSFDVKFT